MASEDGALAVRKPPPPEERPNIWKADGNTKLTEGDYRGALQSYTRGIDAAAESGIEGALLSQLLSNRAQAHSKLNAFKEAVEDCKAAVQKDPSNAKAYWRGANAAMKCGDSAAAAELCTKGLEAVGDSQGLQALLEEAKAAEKEAKDMARNAAFASDLQQIVSTPELAERGAALLERYRAAKEADRDDDDAIRARRIFEKVLVQDRKNEIALIGLGEILDGGWGCDQDLARASELWRIALAAGCKKAEVKLALQALSSWCSTLRAQAMGQMEEGKKKDSVAREPELNRRWRPGDKPDRRPPF